MADTQTQTDQTSPRDAGHTTTEHFWTKVMVILGTVIAVGGVVGEAVNVVTPILPAGVGTWALGIGAVVALISDIAYKISRTLVKLRLAKDDAALAMVKETAAKSPEAAARAVLGDGSEK